MVVSVTVVCILPMQAAQKDDLLQQAFNYVFTGNIAPKDGPEIVDKPSCIVVIRDPRFPRFIRYYFGRLRSDNSIITKTYAGRQTLYKLEVESDNVVVEYLSVDKTNAVQAYKSAQIDLPGDIDQTQKALKVIADRCNGDQSKSPFG